jgi:hypothetical protein
MLHRFVVGALLAANSFDEPAIVSVSSGLDISVPMVIVD